MSSTLVWHYKMTDVWTELLDGFSGRFFWTDVLELFFGRIFGRILRQHVLRRQTWDEIVLGILLYFSVFWQFPKSTPKLHLRMVAGWQINESTLQA